MSRKLTPRIVLVLECDGHTVLDDSSARLLALIEKHGSILRAAKILGMPYSRAWETIARIERTLGTRIVEARRGGRGGGGTILTDEGLKLLRTYTNFFEKLMRTRFNVRELDFSIKLPDIVYMGSHDPAVEYLMGLLKRSGITEVEAVWVGSGCGLAALALGEADIAGVHLYDPETKTYNIAYIKRYWLTNYTVLVRGYRRELGIVHRLGADKTLEELVEGLITGSLRYVNRNRGSGTRVFADAFIIEQAAKLGVKIDLEGLRDRIKGYDEEVSTHEEVASAVTRGVADAGFAIRSVATAYGLNFIPVTWEYFDFVIPKDRLGKKSIRIFIRGLKSREFITYIKNLPGYEPHPRLGTIVEV